MYTDFIQISSATLKATSVNMGSLFTKRIRKVVLLRELSMTCHDKGQIWEGGLKPSGEL